MVAVNYDGQNLVGNNFRGLNRNGSTFIKTRLENVRFDPNTAAVRTQLRGTNFSESIWIGVNASQAIFAPNAAFGPANFFKAALDGVNFTGANLTEAIFNEADLSGEPDGVINNLTNANLTRASLIATRLKGANLTGAILVDANLQGADLESALFFNTNATGANFQLTNFTDGSINNSIFDLANLGGVALTDTRPIDAGGVSNSFRGANLDAFRAEDVVLGNADFRPYDPGLPGSQTGSIRVWENDVLSPDFNKANDIVITNLSNATLPDTNLSNAKFNGTNLNNLIAEDLNLNGADFGIYTTSKGQFIVTNLTNTRLVDNPLKGSEVVIVGAKFNSAIANSFAAEDVDLTNADFSPYTNPATGQYITSAIDAATGLAIDNPSGGPIRTQLNNARLADSILEGANLTLVEARSLFAEGVNLTNASVQGADLESAYLGLATLSGANLTDANLTGANLTTALSIGTNFTNAKLTNADLSKGNFSSAIFFGADLTGAKAVDAIGLYIGDAGDNVLNSSSDISPNDNLFGNDGNDTLSGGGGNDYIDGGGGIDRMNGGGGNDTYVYTAGDLIIENANAGTDSVRANDNHTLPNNVENLLLLDNVLNGTGNALGNNITGNSANNNLNGAGGNDTLTGLGGNDILIGDEGNDSLIGGTGNDTITGGIGSDTIHYASGDGTDRINGFITGAGGDFLSFSGIPAVDVRIITTATGTNTQFRVSDGTPGNAGFGTTGAILLNVIGANFTQADIATNITNSAGTQFLFS